MSPKSRTLIPHQKSLRKKRLSMTLDASLVAALDERGRVRGEQIARDLRRYYRLLAEGRFTLRPRFSTEKLSLILDACNGRARREFLIPGTNPRRRQNQPAASTYLAKLLLQILSWRKKLGEIVRCFAAHSQGVITTLMQPSCLSRNVL
jgi:hypothetical protein